MNLLVVFQWWGVFFAVGLMFLPITLWMFDKFIDKGYIFAKLLGLIVVSFTLWLLSSLHILPYTHTTLWVVIGVFALLNAAFVYVKRDYFWALRTKTDAGYNPRVLCVSVCVTEAVFLAALLFWTYIRGHSPAISGLEKFMDYGFIMSILRAEYMPAPDIWYAGHGINYYYFGHFICATMIRLSGIAPEVGYNLWIATLFAVAVACAFALTGNIIARFSHKARYIITGGTISGLMMGLASNLHTFFEGVIGHLINGKAILVGYWYPDATRYVGYDGSFLPNLTDADRTIHEFPSYSAIVADLHAHYINIMIAFTILALLAVMMMRVLDQLPDYDWRKPGREAPLLALLLGCAFITSTWDFPIYGMMIGIAYLALHLKKLGWCWKALYTAVIHTVAIAVVGYVLVLPFHLQFQHIAGGIGSGVFRGAITLPDKFFILYGHFLIMGGFLLRLLYRQHSLSATKSRKKGKPVAPPKERRFVETWMPVFAQMRPSDMIACVWLLGGLILILLPELIYVRDIYEWGYPRSNTMFKLTYQGYIMFTLALGYIAVRVCAQIKLFRWRPAVIVSVVLCIALPLIYTIPQPFGGGAIDGYYSVTTGQSYVGLDGLGFLQAKYPDDYQAIQWLNENVAGQPVVLEANGDSYTDFTRISMATGLPTVVGWRTHEWLWRGDVDAVDVRIDDVKTIYESEDAAETYALLRQYDVAYIVVGRLEREKFEALAQEKLDALGTVVFDSPETRIIQVAY